MRAISLSGCSDAFDSAPPIAANSHGRPMAIILSDIRDNAPAMRLSFLDACLNLVDTGAKTYPNHAPYHKFAKNGNPRISFWAENWIMRPSPRDKWDIIAPDLNAS